MNLSSQIIKRKNVILLKMENKRLSYFDFLRGLAILMVIGIHTFSIVPFEGLRNIVNIGVRETINFAVPLFLVISGYFIGKKEVCNRDRYWHFIKKQIPRVYIPMLLWSVPMVVLWIYLRRGVAISVVEGFSCMAFGPYYFIALIIQFYLLHPIIKSMTVRPFFFGGGNTGKYIECIFL